MVNDNTELNISIIKNIAQEVKKLNIITNNIRKFKKLEEYLYNELGIMIRISNNRSKDLVSAETILNIDFPKELTSKYTISNDSIIINLCDEIKIESKKFNGININYYSIKIPPEMEIEGFSSEIVYESYLFKMNLENAIKKIREDKVEIKGLIGKNGIINKREFDK